MSARLIIKDIDGNQVEDLELGEVLAKFEQIGDGEQMPLVVYNAGDTHFRDLAVILRGEGADHVQIAMGHKDPVWADAGMPLIFSDMLAPGEEFPISARGTFSTHDVERRYDFRLILNGVSFNG